MTGPRLGFFSRLLEDAPAADRYRFALEQIEAADRAGFSSAWVAQHHFSRDEGGLPSPLVLLAAAAARTTRIRLGTAVLTLPIDDPVRAAEDASVLDAMSGGRVQLGVAPGGTPASFAAFGRDPSHRAELFADHLGVFRDALAGLGVRGTDSRIYPASDGLSARIWQATFGAAGAVRAASAGDGLMLSRTQEKPGGIPLHDAQLPIIEAYRGALDDGAAARVLASRTAVVVDSDRDRTQLIEALRAQLERTARSTVRIDPDGMSLDALVRATDTHVGTVDEVVESLSADRAIAASTDVSFQVHSLRADHETTLRSIELLAGVVAPHVGYGLTSDARAT